MLDEKKLVEKLKKGFAQRYTPLPMTFLIFDVDMTDHYSIEACKNGNDVIYHIDPLKKLDDPTWYRLLNRAIRAVLLQPFFPSEYYHERKIFIDRLPNVVESLAITIKDLCKHPNWRLIHEKIMASLRKEFSRYDDPNVKDYVREQINSQEYEKQKRFLAGRDDLQRIR